MVDSAIRSIIGNPKYSLAFEPVASGLESDVHEGRVKRETESMINFLERTRHKFHNFQELHEWLFSEHSAYSAKRLLVKRKDNSLSAEVLRSY